MQLPAGWDISLSKLVMGIAIIAVAVWGWLTLTRLVRRVAKKDGVRNVLSLCTNILRIIVFVWAACGVCDVWFDVNLASIFEAFGIMGIAITLGAQQTLSNIIGGVIIYLSNLLREGDWIIVGGEDEGRLVDTNWRCTILEDEKGVRHLVPNEMMLTSVVQVAHPYDTLVLSFDLKADAPDVGGVLRECEGLVFDFLKEQGMAFEEMVPLATVASAAYKSIQCQIELYFDRSADRDTVQRDVFNTLIDFLQQRGVLAA